MPSKEDFVVSKAPHEPGAQAGSGAEGRPPAAAAEILAQPQGIEQARRGDASGPFCPLP